MDVPRFIQLSAYGWAFRLCQGRAILHGSAHLHANLRAAMSPRFSWAHTQKRNSWAPGIYA